MDISIAMINPSAHLNDRTMLAVLPHVLVNIILVT